MTAVLAHLPAIHLQHTPSYITSPSNAYAYAQRTPRDRRRDHYPVTELDANSYSCSHSNMTGRGRGKTTKTESGKQTKGKPKVVNFDINNDDDEFGVEATQTSTKRKGAEASGKTAVNGTRHRESESPRTRSKRKALEYEEDIEGFQFSRAPGSKKLRSSPSPESMSPSESPEPEQQPVKKTVPAKARQKKTAKNTPTTKARTSSAATTKPAGKPRTRREVAVAVEIPVLTPSAHKSTNGHGNGNANANANGKAGAGSRRSKRLVDEVSSTVADTENLPSGSKRRFVSRSPDVEAQTIQAPKKRGQKRKTPEPEREPEPQYESPEEVENYDENGAEYEDGDEDVTARVQAATTSMKISLPMSDTPVIRKNKEMRMQDKGKKGGNRRSSLGMRGRRASSLIDSGTSNALPHDAVRTTDFYKHIEGEGLPEPRRMKQLLTWCATRALGAKPSGSRSEDESARLAARVIQEELLKELGSRSELSDWFGRQETTPPPVVVKKPNPKNVQNAEKLKELEEHIQRLQEQRKSLAALLKEPVVPPSQTQIRPSDDAASISKQLAPGEINTSLLDPAQQELLASLRSNPQPQPTADQQNKPPSTEQSTSMPSISTRLAHLSLSLAPTLDSFASGMYDIELFRSTANNLAGRVLGLCAETLEERDAKIALSSRMKTEGGEDDGEGDGDDAVKREVEDVSVVLGALARLERRL